MYGTRFESKLKKGDPYAYLGEGQILEVEKASCLVLSWKANYDEAAAKEKPSRAFELTSSGSAVTKLRLVHDEFKENSAGYAGSVESWPLMPSSLKSFLETGRALEVK